MYDVPLCIVHFVCRIGVYHLDSSGAPTRVADGNLQFSTFSEFKCNMVHYILPVAGNLIQWRPLYVCISYVCSIVHSVLSWTLHRPITRNRYPDCVAKIYHTIYRMCTSGCLIDMQSWSHDRINVTWVQPIIQRCICDICCTIHNNLCII